MIHKDRFLNFSNSLEVTFHKLEIIKIWTSDLIVGFDILRLFLFKIVTYFKSNCKTKAGLYIISSRDL